MAKRHRPHALSKMTCQRCFFLRPFGHNLVEHRGRSPLLDEHEAEGPLAMPQRGHCSIREHDWEKVDLTPVLMLAVYSITALVCTLMTIVIPNSKGTRLWA